MSLSQRNFVRGAIAAAVMPLLGDVVRRAVRGDIDVIDAWGTTPDPIADLTAARRLMTAPQPYVPRKVFVTQAQFDVFKSHLPGIERDLVIIR